MLPRKKAEGVGKAAELCGVGGSASCVSVSVVVVVVVGLAVAATPQRPKYGLAMSQERRGPWNASPGGQAWHIVLPMIEAVDSITAMAAMILPCSVRGLFFDEMERSTGMVTPERGPNAVAANMA